MHTVHAKRIAKYGRAYTVSEFCGYYGAHGIDMFNECPCAEQFQSEQPHAVISSSGCADGGVLQPAPKLITVETTENMQTQMRNLNVEQLEPEQPHAGASSSGYADSCVLQPAAEHTTLIRSTAAPEKRIAKDGVAYTLEEFCE